MADEQKRSSEDWSNKETPLSQHEQHYKDLSTLPEGEVQQTEKSLTPNKTSSNLQNTRARLGLHPVSAPLMQ